MARQEPAGASTSRLLMLAAIVIVVAALYFARDVLIPIALAILFSFLLGPLVHRLERWRFPRVAAVLLVVFATFIFIGGIGWIITGQVRDLASHMERYRGEIEQKIHSARHFFGTGPIGKSTEFVKDLGRELTTTTTQPAAVTAKAPPKVQIVEPSPTAVQVLENTIGALFAPLATAAIVVILAIFMLLNREDLRDRMIRLIGEGQLNVTTQALNEAAGRVSKYLLMQTLINGSYGVLLCVGLSIIGIPTPLLWGLLAGLLRFIPYVGPWMGASMPVLLSLTMPGFWPPVFTGGLFIVLELTTNSLVEPWLYGASAGVSSIAILIAAVFWAWLWGGVGLILATPLTVCLVVIGKYVPQLNFLDILLGDEPVLDVYLRYYQRLLSGDHEEAAELVEEYMKDRTLTAAYDEVVLPGLALAARDYRHGNLDAERLAGICAAVRELVEYLGEQETEEQAKAPENEKREERSPEGKSKFPEQYKRVLCISARDEEDEVATIMLAQVLRLNGVSADVIAGVKLTGELVEVVGNSGAEVVCISALPPSGVTHSRYLCKRLRRRFADLEMIVGIWTLRGEAGRLKERMGNVKGVAVATTLADAVNQFRHRGMAAAKG